jgi:hypothetical protein
LDERLGGLEIEVIDLWAIVDRLGARDRAARGSS